MTKAFGLSPSKTNYLHSLIPIEELFYNLGHVILLTNVTSHCIYSSDLKFPNYSFKLNISSMVNICVSLSTEVKQPVYF